MSVVGNLKKKSVLARNILLSLLAVLLILAFAFRGGEVKAGARAEIGEIVVGNSCDDLLLYLELDKAFRPEMEEGILNGIPVLFTFHVIIRRVEEGEPEKQLTDLEFNHLLSYDSLKEAFKLRFSEKNLAIAVKEFEEAKTLMSEVNGVRVIELSRLERGGTYSLSVKVRLERENLPLFFQYLIPFWQLRDEETDWRNVEFRY